MAEPKILTPAVLTTHALPFTTNAENLYQQAVRAEIVDAESFGKAVDHIKVCQSQHNSAEAQRKNLTAPLNNHVAWINDQFRPITDRITQAKTLMKGKGATWKIAEDERVAAEEKRVREEAEAQALKDAVEAEETGDTEKAAAIVDAAADTPKGVVTAPTGRGSFTGASGGVRKTWLGEVADAKDVCAAIADGHLNLDLIKEFSKKAMNSMAKDIEKEGTFLGIKITEKKEMAVR